MAKGKKKAEPEVDEDTLTAVVVIVESLYELGYLMVFEDKSSEPKDLEEEDFVRLAREVVADLSD